MNIEISNHPEFPTIIRKYQACQIIIDLIQDSEEFEAINSKIEGFVKNYNSEGKTPLGFNENGKYQALVADNNTKVNPETGQYDESSEVGELDYIGDFDMNLIGYIIGKSAGNIKVKDVLKFILQSSVVKQDSLERFNK